MRPGEWFDPHRAGWRPRSVSALVSVGPVVGDVDSQPKTFFLFVSGYGMIVSFTSNGFRSCVVCRMGGHKQ